MKHLCETCNLEFATCKIGEITFSIDVYPNLKGKEADKVLRCENYQSANAKAEKIEPSLYYKHGGSIAEKRGE